MATQALFLKAVARFPGLPLDVAAGLSQVLLGGANIGEHAAIFYRHARFERLANGDFWLSETPERPSMGWDARCCKRIA